MKLLMLLYVLSNFMVSNGDYVRVCYYTNWSQYRVIEGRFKAGDIDPTLCTHIVFAFLRINRDTSQIEMVEWNDREMIRVFNSLKRRNKNLKTLLAIGGWMHEEKDSPFSIMVKNPFRRNRFIETTINFLRTYGFDGIDLDWEYPGVRGGSPPGDKQKFSILCSELKAAFEKEAIDNNNERLLLTAAVASSQPTINAAYEIPKLAESLDFINLLSYDLYGPWNNFTAHHSSMDGSMLTVPKSLNEWTSLGMPANKIALGIAGFGRTVKLADVRNHGLFAQSTGAGNAGPYTKAEGLLAYYEICEKDWTEIVKSNQAMAPYAYKDDQWVSYDDVDSVKYKVQRLIIDRGLKGAMIWTIDFDDFSGMFCNQGSFPILNAIKSTLQKHEEKLKSSTTTTITTTTLPPTTTLQPTTTTSTTTTTLKPTTTTTTTLKPTTTTTTLKPTTTTTTTLKPTTTTTTILKPTTTTSTTITPPTTTSTTTTPTSTTIIPSTTTSTTKIVQSTISTTTTSTTTKVPPTTSTTTKKIATTLPMTTSTTTTLQTTTTTLSPSTKTLQKHNTIHPAGRGVLSSSINIRISFELLYSMFVISMLLYYFQ